MHEGSETQIHRSLSAQGRIETKFKKKLLSIKNNDHFRLKN